MTNVVSACYARSGWSKNPHKLSQTIHVKAEKLDVAGFGDEHYCISQPSIV